MKMIKKDNKFVTKQKAKKEKIKGIILNWGDLKSYFLLQNTVIFFKQ